MRKSNGRKVRSIQAERLHQRRLSTWWVSLDSETSSASGFISVGCSEDGILLWSACDSGRLGKWMERKVGGEGGAAAQRWRAGCRWTVPDGVWTGVLFAMWGFAGAGGLGAGGGLLVAEIGLEPSGWGWRGWLPLAPAPTFSLCFMLWRQESRWSKCCPNPAPTLQLRTAGVGAPGSESSGHKAWASLCTSGKPARAQGVRVDVEQGICRSAHRARM